MPHIAGKPHKPTRSIEELLGLIGRGTEEPEAPPPVAPSAPSPGLGAPIDTTPEGPFKDFLDAIHFGAEQFLHSTKQGADIRAVNLFATLPKDIKFLEDSERKLKLLGAPSFAETKRIMLTEFSQRSKERKADFESWVRKNPQLLPRKQEYTEGIGEHPELIRDPNYWAYLIGSSFAYSAAAMAAFGVGTLAGGPVAGVAAATSVVTPGLTDELFNRLTEAGADEEQARTLSTAVGPVMGLLESLADVVKLKALTGGAGKKFFSELSENIVLGMFFRGVGAAGEVTASEALTEATQEFVANITVKTINDNQDLLENVVEAGVTGAMASAGFAGVGGVSSAIGGRSVQRQMFEERGTALERTPEQVASELGLSFDGMQETGVEGEELLTFTVREGPEGVKGATFVVQDLSEVEGRLAEKFTEFGVEETAPTLAELEPAPEPIPLETASPEQTAAVELSDNIKKRAAEAAPMDIVSEEINKGKPTQTNAQIETEQAKDPQVKSTKKELVKDKIARIRESYRKREQTQDAIRKELVSFVNANVPLESRGKLLTAVKNAKTRKLLAKAIARAEKIAEDKDQQTLRAAIKSELKSVTPKKQKGILKGKFGADVQEILELIKTVSTASRAVALDKIVANAEAFEKGEITQDELAFDDLILSMTGTDAMSASELSRVHATIRELKETGKFLVAAKSELDSARITQIKDKVIDVVTGDKGLKPETGTVAAKDLEPSTNVFSRIANWMFGWTTIMNKLSKFDKSKPFSSMLSRFTNQVYVARAVETIGLEQSFADLQSGLKTALGVKKDKDLNRELNLMAADNLSIGPFVNGRGVTVTLKMNRTQLVAKYMQLQDPTLEETFKDTMAWTDVMITAVENKMTEQDIRIADSLMDFYNHYYDGVNEVYREIFNIDMPKNPWYSPIQRDVESFKDVKDVKSELLLMVDELHRYASTLSPTLKARVRSKSALKFDNAFQTVVNHITQLEHFKAWTKTISDQRRVFNDKDVQTAIKQYHGPEILSVVHKFIDNMARGRAENALTIKFVDDIRKNFTRAILGLKPDIAIKQIPSVLAYTSEMPYSDFVTGVLDFWSNPKANFEFMSENSAFIRKRFKAGFERDIVSAMETGAVQQLTNAKTATQHILGLIRLGDKFAVMQGFWAKYKSGLKEGLSPEEAILQAEITTSRTQPTSELESLSLLQQGGSFWKLFTMFQNQPNKYFQMIANNARDFKYNRGSRAKAAANIILAWVILPSLFQFIADGFDYEPKHQARAAGLGGINNILAAGQIIQNMWGWLTDEPFDYSGSPVFDTVDDINKFLQKTSKIVQATADPKDAAEVEDLIKAVEFFAEAVGQATGIPTPYLIRVEKAIRNGNLAQFFFSEYALEGREKKPEPFRAPRRKRKPGDL